jgi:2-O-methyltransferase
MAKKLTGPPEVYFREAREHIRMFRQNMGANPIVVEIGCNDGMHTKIFKEEIPNLTIHCFEPDPRPIPRFMEQAGSLPGVYLYTMAVAAKDGPVPWFASGGTTKNSWLDDWDLSGSIRRPTGHLQLSPWVTFKEAGHVNGITLDSWADMLLGKEQKIDLVFADVQGAEGDMIAGGQKAFAERVRYLWTEFYDTPMYEGQPNLDQILALLPGYTLVQKYKTDAYLKNTRLA